VHDGPRRRRRALGQVAYVRDGALDLLDLGNCRVRELMRSGAAAPVRFSADGRWLGFGAATLAAASGGRVERPLREDVATGDQDRTWGWAPAGEALAGATKGGGVLVGAPGRAPRRLEREGWGATNVRFADAHTLLVTRAGTPARPAQLWQLALPGGRATLAYRASKPTASLQLAGAVGGWALLWRNALGSASLAEDGPPLLAVSLATGRTVRLSPAVLVDDDFVARCGQGVAIVNGAIRETTLGKRITLLAPPAWRPRDLGPGITPSCSASGGAVALSAGPQGHERIFGDEGRSIWLARPGRKGRELSPEPVALTDERPLLTPDGRTVLYVHTGPPRSRGPNEGSVFLGALYAGSATGQLPVHPVGPIVDLGTAGNYYGTYSWALQLDWRPRPRGS
jgi:hypothetical protein